jgi:hypothetical protein
VAASAEAAINTISPRVVMSLPPNLHILETTHQLHESVDDARLGASGLQP